MKKKKKNKKKTHTQRERERDLFHFFLGGLLLTVVDKLEKLVGNGIKRAFPCLVFIYLGLRN